MLLSPALLFSLSLLALASARIVPSRHTRDCKTNAECLRRGLPIKSPNFGLQRLVHRSGQSDVAYLTDCTTSSITLPRGLYVITVAGAEGGDATYPRNSPTFPGVGAVTNITVDIVVDSITFGTSVGCQPASNPNYAGAGGGGSFVYFRGNGLPAAFVAGGGGGVGIDQSGVDASTNPNGDATAGTDYTNQPVGTPATGGHGGSTPQAVQGEGGAGGGFTTSGQDGDDDGGGGGKGGSTSPNYGGTFAGGAGSAALSGPNGGFGGGGGAGYAAGGGGGGYSGGGGGATAFFNGGLAGGGGGGGGSFVNSVDLSYVVVQSSIVATQKGNGYIKVTSILP